MKTILISLLLASNLAYAKDLKLHVFTGNEAGFLATSTVIEGEKEAVLIDGQFTRSSAHRLVADLIESGKTLTTVFITHAHPDHYFGLEIVKAQFPSVKILARPEVAEQMKTMGPAKLSQWKPMYGANLTDAPLQAEAFAASSFSIEGQDVQIIDLEPGEIENSSVFFIPSLKAVVTGDLVYNGVHPWLAEADAARRDKWLANLEKIAALKPTTVVAGHKVASAKDSPDAIVATAKYIRDFKQALAKSKDAAQLEKKMTALYPKLQLPIILNIATKAAFPTN